MKKPKPYVCWGDSKIIEFCSIIIVIISMISLPILFTIGRPNFEDITDKDK